MSENLATKDLNTVNAMSCDLEMGELRKISTLQDIPLADGVSAPQIKTAEQKAEEENERRLKTNSLKRFFRLSPKKKLEDGTLEADKNEVEFEEENIESATAGHKESGHKQSGHKESGHKDLTGSFSKASIKSSLNTYWNSVFKQKKSKKSSKSQLKLQSNADEASSSTNAVESRLPLPDDEPQDNSSSHVDDIVLEEVQSLQISEETTPK